MNKKDLQIIKKIVWQQRQERDKNIGRARTKSWGGKDDPKTDRRKTNQRLRKDQNE